MKRSERLDAMFDCIRLDLASAKDAIKRRDKHHARSMLIAVRDEIDRIEELIADKPLAHDEISKLINQSRRTASR